MTHLALQNVDKALLEEHVETCSRHEREEQFQDTRAMQFKMEKRQTFQRDQLMSALSVCITVNYESIANEIVQSFGKKSPVSMLMEHAQYARAKVNFVQVGQPDGPDHRPLFTMVAVVDGHPYTRVKAACKRDCRTGAAYLAWKSIIKAEQMKFQSIVLDKSTTEEDHMAALSHLEYLQQVEKNPLAFSGRRVLAAVLEKTQKGRKPKIKVVGLGTGNRCILSHHLSLDGMSVNDSHAEVIARRAFMRYLYSQIVAIKSGCLDTILKPSFADEVKWRLKDEVTYHLYTSSAPCGDASLFSRESLPSTNSCNEAGVNGDESSELKDSMLKPIYSSSVQGLLRTKIEAGEGSIPVERRCLQSWIGLQFGDRLRTMSCSDKILKWNVVGIQGALLSYFVEPIYFTSIIVGEPYVFGHLARALYHRLLRDTDLPLVLPAGYRINCPVIRHTRLDGTYPETEKSTAATVFWYHGIGVAEVTDGTTGKFVEESGFEREVPSACKKALFEKFKTLCGSSLKDDIMYVEVKKMAGPYQEAKDAFHRHVSAQGYGDWIKKPAEVDYFT